MLIDTRCRNTIYDYARQYWEWTCDASRSDSFIAEKPALAEWVSRYRGYVLNKSRLISKSDYLEQDLIFNPRSHPPTVTASTLATGSKAISSSDATFFMTFAFLDITD